MHANAAPLNTRLLNDVLHAFVTRLTRRMPLVEQELITLPKHPPVLNGVRVTRSLVLYVCFVDRCLSFLSFFFWPLCCLSCFDVRILIYLFVLFVLFLLAIVLSVLLRCTDSDLSFSIFKLFLLNFIPNLD